ncbi:tRNA (N6-isopentenyl adenosine(37)-C2)-methylthiotransferase MiaB [Candidatus Marinamargulisbacteria bacterium SCGC AG-410-N11]|nr:tRNA (N6-isopentenyl adenosine(37)-C2)-methylthiotransferase MiaB [Candidatus Marinamargulisbacteria bacterium SCGC AG-410-N11]
MSVITKNTITKRTTTKAKKSVFIETYGCQMNVYDTQLVLSILQKHDYKIALTEKDADIVMLNTCSVRDKANQRIYNRVHTLRQESKHPLLIGILGCMATNFKTDLLENKRLGIDFIAGPDSYKELPNLIKDVTETGEKSYDVTLSEFETYSDIYPTHQSGVNAWLAIMRGCNNFCTFCVVPYTRGRERSRDPHNIVKEVQRLVSDGFKQVTLLGQNVNSYKFEQYDFTDLMTMVSDVPGLKRVRFTSPHPKDFPTKLLKVMNERDNLCNQLHVPLQAGNDRVLKKMNRSYTKQEFLDLIVEMKALIPDVSLSTDVIVGFPTETDEEFKDTIDVMKKVEFDHAFMFKYSERPNTRAAAKFPDDIPEEVKAARLAELIDIQKNISLNRYQRHIGTIEDILIEEEFTKKNKDMAMGRNDSNKIVLVPNNNLKKGEIYPVKIVGASPHALRAEQVASC